MAGIRAVNRNIVPGVRSDVQPLVEEVVDVIRRHVTEGPLRVYLFGSWAQGRALNVSDLDIAFDTGSLLDFRVYTDMALKVDDLLTLRKIDLVDLHTVDHGFREDILECGELLYAR